MVEEKIKQVVNYIASWAKTVDDFLDNIGLGRPVTKIVDFFEVTAPAELAKKAGLPPAPGEVIDSAVAEFLRDIETGEFLKRIPKPFEGERK